MAKTIIVTGSRAHTDIDLIWGKLEQYVEPQTVIVQGGAKGADRIGQAYADANALHSVTFYADWNTHGKAAGMIRNREMLDAYPEALVLAFPLGESRGTRGCIAEARKRGITVKVFERGNPPMVQQDLLPC